MKKFILPILIVFVSILYSGDYTLNIVYNGADREYLISDISLLDVNDGMDTLTVNGINGWDHTYTLDGIDSMVLSKGWTGQDQPLSVGLTSFTASAGDKKVTLCWITESETENLGFIIKRCLEKEGSYVDISSYKNNKNLIGNGNTSQRTEYSYIDENVINGEIYWYKLIDVSLCGIMIEHEAISAKPKVYGDKNSLHYALYSNYPNPFNPKTKIRFDVPQSKTNQNEVSLTIYNYLGQKVKTLVSGNLSAGEYEIMWDGKNENGRKLSSGLFFLKMSSDKYTKIQKMVLIR